MERKTVRGVYENGELRLAEPVDVEGCWTLEITFLERQADESQLAPDPHLPERTPLPERMEELHRQVDTQAPHHRRY